MIKIYADYSLQFLIALLSSFSLFSFASLLLLIFFSLSSLFLILAAFLSFMLFIAIMHHFKSAQAEAWQVFAALISATVNTLLLFLIYLLFW